MALQEFLKTAESLAKECGVIAKCEAEMARHGSVFVKGSNSSDIVTEIDRKIEQIIIDSLKKKYPSHKFIGEESVNGACRHSDDPTWIIDPIDGTCNFIHGIPYAAICIGLTINKEVVVGVIYNFFLDQLYSAMKGGGANLNGKPIHVTNCKVLKQALVLTEVGAERDEPDLHSKVSTIHCLTAESCHVLGIRCIGSSALSCCMVADGTADSYVEYEVHCWDFAAGEIIVREAGGVTLHPTGAPLDLMSRGVLVACSMELAQAMIPYIQHCHYYPRD